MFSSNIFKRATKEIKYTHSGTQGNADITDVRGYSKAIIQFSGDVKCNMRGYIDSNRDGISIFPQVTNDKKRWLRNSDITTKTIIVDVANLSVMYISFNEAYTGDVFVLLTQDKFEIEWNGTTRIATKYINVVDGTNVYSTDFIEGFEPFRFYAIQVKRRDGNGYTPFTADFKEYQKINKEQGVGPDYSGGKLILSVSDVINGWAESEWMENYTNAVDIDVVIDGATYDGALLEINIIGIA